MLFGNFIARLRGRLAAFNRSDRGNVALTFALATIPLVGLVGAAVDYSRGNSAKVSMQAAIDSTALMLSKEAQKLTSTQLKEKAVQFFTTLFHRPEVTNLVVTPTFVDNGSGNFKLTIAASGKVPTSFTKIIGQDNINLSTSSEVVWGVKKLELALALDVTGSMNSNNKMTELKKAAKSLLTTLKNAAKKDGDVKVAIVPFAVNVNAGPTYVGATWLDWSDWSSEPAIMATWLQTASNKNAWDRIGAGSSCPFSSGNHGFRCTNGPGDVSNDSTVNNIPTTGNYSGLICPGRDDGSKSTSTTGILTGRYYNGCYTTVEKANNEWHPVTTGTNATCGNLTSPSCQCTGSSSNKVCAMTPDSNWQPVAQGSNASCGNLSACQCFGSGNSKVCKQKTYTHTWRPRPKSAWDGCVRDRNQDYDAQNTAPSSTPSLQKTNINGVSENYPSSTNPLTGDNFQPYQHVTCPAALLPLTFDWTALTNKVDQLQPNGNTNVTIGLTWAFHALTTSAPIGTAAAPATELDKVIILLTDGENTQNRFSGNSSTIDERTQKACANVKAANIKVYTIRVIDGNTSLLQGCATRSDMFYNVQNASDLNNVFTTIAQNLANLRIAK